MISFTRFLFVALSCLAVAGCDAPQTRQSGSAVTLDNTHSAADTAWVLADEPEPCTTCRTEEAYPGQPGTPRTITINGQKVTVDVIEGKVVWQGDMILPPTVLRDSSIKSKTGATIVGRRWPAKEVFYQIDPALPNSARVAEAIAHWEAKTPIRFRKRTSVTPNFVTFTTGPGCGSLVGMQGREQLVRLTAGCSRGNVIHEIGHVVGLLHEVMRDDRDSNVRIKTANIRLDKLPNFQKYLAAGLNGRDDGKFDFNSRMLYKSNAFSKDEAHLLTITRLDGSGYPTNYDTLSNGDVAAVNRMYP